LSCTSLDVFSVINMGPGIFKDPSLFGGLSWSTTSPPPFYFNTSVCSVFYWHKYQRQYSLSQRPLPTSKVPPVKELLPQEFPENPTPPLVLEFLPHPLGENTSLGDSSPRHYPNPLFLPPTWIPSIQGSFYSQPSKHGSCHPFLVSSSTLYGSYTISPSSDRKIT
jgi:hypothetical protein